MERTLMRAGKAFGAAVLLACLIGVGAACGVGSQPVRIGVVAPLSGAASGSGEDLLDGLSLAVEEINAQGGINSRPIELMVQDSRTDPQAGLEAYQELLKKDPLLVITSVSSVSLALAREAEEKKAFLAALVATDPDVTQGKTWTFRYFPTASVEVLALSRLLSGLPAGALGVIYLDDAYGRSIYNEMMRLASEPLDIVARPFAAATEDFGPDIQAVAHTDTVVLAGFTGHIAALLKGLKAAGYQGRVATTTTGTLPAIRRLPEAQGVYVAAPAIYNKNFVFARAASQRFGQRFGKEFNQYNANSYDFMHLLAGLLTDREVTAANLKRLFEQGFVYSGVFGNIELKKGQQDIIFPLRLGQIDGGAVEYR